MAPIADPYPLYARLRREEPVKKVGWSGHPSVFVTRFDDVHAILRNHELFSSRSNAERGIALVMGRTLIGMDGHEHLKHRALITPAVAPRRCGGGSRAVGKRLPQGTIAALGGGGKADLVADFTFLYPLRVFTE